MTTIPRKIKRRLNLLHRRAPPGAAPGTLLIDPEAPPPRITVIAYGPEDVQEQQVEDLSGLDALMERWPVVWVNIDGLGDEAVLRSVAERFGIHRLAMEDVVNVYQRPKLEEFPEHAFIVVRMAMLEEQLRSEQLSLFLGEGLVLTFQERAGDCFDQVRKRIRDGRGRIRKASSDYLAYALIDAVIDGYYPILEVYGERIEALEDTILQEPTKETVTQIHQMKRELLALRRAVWPKRELVNTLVRGENPLVTDETRVYLRDCYDHTIQIIDMLETYRELASGLMDMYLSSISNRMNEIMKVLTIFAAIFIPLGFIAGLYGMNFNPDLPGNMPETQWPYGYLVALGLMATVAGGLLLFFRRKRWLG